MVANWLERHTRDIFMTSSPRWLMTLTAIRPDSGFSNGRDVSLFSVAHASSLISALARIIHEGFGLQGKVG